MEILNIKHGPDASEILDAILWQNRVSFEIEDEQDPSCMEAKISSIRVANVGSIDYAGSISIAGSCTIIKSYDNNGSIFVRTNQNRQFVANYSPNDKKGRLEII